MDLVELKTYLYDHIPLSKAMEVEVVQADSDKVVLRAPLAPNINHRETVFGGSASALAILSAWTLLYVRLQQAGLRSRVVIQRNSMHYLHAIPESFEAVATIEDAQVWQRFVHMLTRKQRARINVAASLYCQGEKVGALEGDFVALGLA
jgi:thioesterase domain-containing protein